MIECAKQEGGIIQLPLYLLNDTLKAEELVEILPDLQTDYVHVYYYYPQYRYIQPKVPKFINLFLSRE